MSKNYVQDGNTVRFTAAAAVKSGDVVMLENLAAIAISDVEKSAVGVGLTTGVFTVKAKAADDIKQGAIVYWSADKVITDVMMSVYVINGKEYKAVLDETPKEMEPMNGVYRTLTMFKSSGYKPKKGDKTTINGVDYVVTGFTFNSGTIMLQLEEDASY